MSMIGGVEASTAAGEILYLIKQLKEKYKDDPKAHEALQEVEAKAQQIKEAGDAGWY